MSKIKRLLNAFFFYHGCPMLPTNYKSLHSKAKCSDEKETKENPRIGISSYHMNLEAIIQ